MKRSPKAVGQVDATIGRRLKAERTRAGISLTQVDAAIGVAFQQIQRDENGSNRLSLVRAMQLAALIGTTVNALVADPP